MMFQPKKIKESDLKMCRQEQEHVKDMFNGKLSWPAFPSNSKILWKKDLLKKRPKRLLKNSLHFMLNEVINLIYNIKFANLSMRKCKKSLAHFNAIRFMLPEEHAAKLFTWYFIHDTISMQNSVLELIRNLQLGEYKNVYEAKHKLISGSMLTVNFGRQDLFHVIKNFDCETSSLLQVKHVTLPAPLKEPQ